MIELHTWATPNGMKVQILLEELGLPYTLKPVRLGAGEQKQPGFQTLNPNGKIPVIVETGTNGGAPFVLRESGAILVYLADRHGQFIATEPKARATILEWIMFQMSFVGPMFGQLHHFQASAPEKIAYALDRYESEGNRLLAVLDRRLDECPWLAGDAYTIADMCTWPWIRSWIHTLGKSADHLPALWRWYTAIEARPAVRKSVDTYLSLRGS